jgi:23S rRNA (uridine2552-2'-O)-methyltransferase
MKRQKDTRQDSYFKKAKEENYPARSVYKLQEINKKYRLVKPGDFVLDIGCAPGSWMIYLSDKVGRKGKVIGVDIVDLKIPLKENMKFIKGDVRKMVDSFDEKFDIVVSDAAPGTSGVHFVDVAKSLELGKAALDVVKQSLKPRGIFICKIFEGEGTAEFLKEVKSLFISVKSFRPSAVRKYSREFYLIAKVFKNE